MGCVPFSILGALGSPAAPFHGPSTSPVLPLMELGSERRNWQLMESKCQQLWPDTCFPSE